MYVFGDGQSGQLGLGTTVLEASTPTLVTSMKDIKIRYTACGENFTAAISGRCFKLKQKIINFEDV